MSDPGSARPSGKHQRVGVDRASVDQLDHEGAEQRGAAATIARVIGHGLWILIPVFSFGFLAWLPAVQVWWRARSTGWLLAAATLTLSSAGIITGAALDAGGAGWGLLILGAAAGGSVAAATGRNIMFDRRAPEADPALQAALANRTRRAEARAITERDPALALELCIGRPDQPRSYADGGLIDLNNTPAASITEFLGWDIHTAENFVAERDAREGYRSLAEIGALSSLHPGLLEAGAERIVVLPYQHIK